MPPTERNGRVHTSTVTVAVSELKDFVFKLKESDVQVSWFSGTGAGGQHRNKHQNSCRLTHVPTGAMATAQERSRQTSYAKAWSALEEKVGSGVLSDNKADEDSLVRQQIGSGQRGDKTRTYRFRDDQVKDHTSGKTQSCARVMRGFFEELWN